MVKKIKNQNTDKKKVHELSKRGTIIEHFLKKREKQIEKGIYPMPYNDIAKGVGVDKSKVYYYSKCRPNPLYEKNKSKHPKKYINYILNRAADKKLTQISGAGLADEVNKKLKKDGVLNKKRMAFYQYQNPKQIKF